MTSSGAFIGSLHEKIEDDLNKCLLLSLLLQKTNLNWQSMLSPSTRCLTIYGIIKYYIIEIVLKVTCRINTCPAIVADINGCL